MRRVLLLLPLVLLAGCGEEPAPPPPPRPVLFIEVQPVSEQPLGQFAGSIQARVETTLGFRVGGRIARRLLDVGDAVRAGDTLASLDPTDQQNAVRSSEGDLARLQAQWLNAQADARRQQELYDRGVGAKANLDQALTELRTLGASRDQAQASLQQTRDQLGYAELKTDFDGVVREWHAEVGQVVAAGQEVVTVARPEVREAVFDLPSGLFGQLPPDVRFQVTAALDPSQSTTGTVREIEPQADPATRTRRVRLTLADVPSGFLLGTTVNVSLAARVAPRTVLPASAVQRLDGSARVWVIDADGKHVHPRPVKILAEEDDQVTVDAELQRGDRVVTAGVNSLEEGQAIRVEGGIRP